MEIEENPANSLVKPSDSGDEWAKSGEVIRDLSNESAKRGEGSVKGNEAGITTSARTSFELVGADWPGCERRRTAGAWPVDCRGVKSPRFRAEHEGSPSLPLSLPA